MNFKRNYRLDLQPSWVGELTFSVYEKPEKFYMSDRYTYGEALEIGKLSADAHGSFCGAKNEPNTVTRYSFIMHAEKKRYLSLIVAINARSKIWCNRRLIGICNVCSPVLIVPLKKGKNRFDIDMFCPEETPSLQIRTEEVDSRSAFPAGADDNLELTQKRFCWYMERSCYPDGKDPEFILMPFDQRLFPYHKRVKLQLRDHDSGCLLMTRWLRFGKVYSIPWKKLVYDPHALNRVDMIITCKRRDGKVEEKCRGVYNTKFETFVPELLEKARQTACDTVWSETRRNAIHSMIARVEAEQARPAKLTFAEILKDLIDDPAMATEGERYTSGNKRIFFYDPLDDTENFYRITLPKNYDPTRKYSLFLICCTKEYGSYGSRFADAGFEDMIVADVSVRGITLGGYIGEAALLHALADIQRVYRIDPNRIYIGGYSNGASAALAAAQAYPHLFAGVYALSGRAENNKMCNLSNLHTLLITSPDDEFYADALGLANAKGTDPDKLQLVSVLRHTHMTIQRVWLNREALAKFFSHEREPYPMRFTYFTDRNRHLQAYWVRLHGIKPETKGCKISVDAGRSTVNITVRGATGLTIDLPPFIHREKFTVRINGREFTYQNVAERQMHFVHGRRGFHRAMYPLIPECAYKGNGLLDVYMDPMCVVIPENASGIVKDAAQAMARPQSNGTTPEISVWYKTHSLSELLDNKRYLDHSMIVVGKDDSPFYQELDRHCAVHTASAGYSYLGEFTDTPYCCMQILQSPWNGARHILYITYSDEKLLRRNLFTRCMVLPSYIQGRHPYLNRSVLIFDGKNYLTAEMPNDPLKIVGEKVS